MTPDRWSNVERLYHAALEREAGQRGAFLAEACAGDEALRREVESLLAQPASAHGFLGEPAVAVAAQMITNPGGTMMTGRRLGAYEVQGLLGAGGMGEVYRARDTKLGREVAIKILPRAFSDDPERLARFEREARVLAALNHPHIGAIYGVEEAEGVRALVLELVDGPTLAEQLSAGPLPLARALGIARQIAEALEAAHEKGIIHRDLKPANVKITRDGVVKVLDFGLAKIGAGGAGGAGEAGGAGGDEFSQSPTVTIGGTREGMILGTAAYMSPEQARGQAVDRRTDIWAFGCVLYEMLSGRAAFPAATVSDTIAGILKNDPDWNAFPHETPVHVTRLLHRCLEKDPKRRLRDIGDARMDIDEAAAAPLSVSVAVSPSARTRRAGLWLSVATIGAIVGGVLVWSLRPEAPVTPPSVARLALPLGVGEQIAPGETSLAVSPDGAYFAYVEGRAGSTKLYLRALAEREAKVVSEGAGDPFFSPDSQWLGFVSGGKLKKVPVHGGPPITLCDAPSPRGASWGDDGFIVFAPLSRSGLSRVSANGGAPQIMTTPDSKRGETSHRFPSLLPGGNAVVYTAEGNSYEADAIVAFSLATKQSRVLIQGGTVPRFVPTGHLVYRQAGALMAVPFDPIRLEMTGTPVPIVEGAGPFAFSKIGGSLFYVSNSGAGRKSALVWVDRHGRESPLPAAPQVLYHHPRLSPDAQRVLVEIWTGADRNVWMYDIARDALTRVTFEGSNMWPVWTPDGRRVTYASNRAGTSWDIFWRPADGSGAEEPLLQRALEQAPRAWSPDGELLAFNENTVAGGQDIWLLPMRDRHAPRPFLQTPASEWEPDFSHDGRWLAYVSNESGRSEVYVRPVSGAAGKWKISEGGGVEPMWAASGRELFYRAGERVLAADVTMQPGFAPGKTRPLFEGRYELTNTGSRDYDVTRDAERFLMVKLEDAGGTATQVSVVENWFEELKQRVSVGAK